jgi:hypothetical protein
VVRVSLGVALVVVAIAAVILPAASAKLDKARNYEGECSAILVVQSLNTAQVKYNSRVGRYARSLTELGPMAANLISSDLASGERPSYMFIVSGTPAGYTISAAPTVFGSAGSRTFYSDQSLAIRENYGQEPATADSKEVGSAAAKAGVSK